MASSASVVRTFHRATTLSSRLAAARPYSACLHTSAILRAEVSNKDPQLGDYPELPFVNLQERKYDPRWWDPQEKRNFGEVLHEQDDMMGVWAPDVFEKSPSSALRQFLVAMGVAASFAGLVYITKPDRPSHPRQYPRDGLLAELGGVPGTAGPVEGAFDKQEGGDDDEDSDDDDE